jgi:myosin heavy subunit
VVLSTTELVPGSVYDVPLNPAQAGAGRDALAKAIYNNLFEWIVARVNVSMKAKGAHAQLIGVLVSRHPSAQPVLSPPGYIWL